MPSITDIFLGKIGGNSHPIHPATVHLPIAFLITASVLDILSFLSISCSPLLTLLAAIFSNTSNPIAIIYYLQLFSFASTAAGILTSLPALTSGLFEGYALFQKHGLDLSNPLVKTTALHAGLNDLAILGAVYNLLSRIGTEAYMSTGGNTLVSVAMLGGVGYAAFLGGGLVYTHGVGVQRMGMGKVERDKGRAEAKKDL